jgi:hypothetical protein
MPRDNELRAILLGLARQLQEELEGAPAPAFSLCE